MINNNHTAFGNDPVIGEYIFRKRQTKWTERKLSPITFEVLQKNGYIGAEYTTHSKFDVTTSILISNKPHSTYQKTPGNSYISYFHHSCKWKGCITNIIKLPDREHPLLVVNSLVPLNEHDKHKDPYYLLPDLLNASVLLDKHGGYHVVECENVIGQLVVIKNETGTFDIQHPTISAVELMNLVSLS
jgi:hypothetical protein